LNSISILSLSEDFENHLSKCRNIKLFCYDSTIDTRLHSTKSAITLDALRRAVAARKSRQKVLHNVSKTHPQNSITGHNATAKKAVQAFCAFESKQMLCSQGCNKWEIKMSQVQTLG
jgi:hypothetical protein